MVSLGLIGRRLGHSFSARYFAEKFRREGVEGTYGLFELPEIDGLPGLLAERPDLQGLNVTVPYKESVIRYLDEISDDARAIGAVNVISITRGERVRLKGYNTDWTGFRDSTAPLLSPGLKGALVLGTGGASKAVCHALRSSGIDVMRVSRHPGGRADTIGYDGIVGELSDRLLIVNTTPLGMYPDTESAPPLPYGMITDRHVCVDIVYNPTVTRFMALCAAQGATVRNGLGMLHTQADHAWDIWSREDAGLLL